MATAHSPSAQPGRPPTIGSRVDECGVLIVDGDVTMLRRDEGGRFQLDLHRVAAIATNQRVRVIGVLVGEGLLDVDLIEQI